MLFEDWIEQAYSLGASDLHLEADTPIVVRIRGELQTVGATVSAETLQQVARDLLRDQWQEFLERGSADHAESVGGIRLRANFFQTVRGIAVAIRLLAPSVKDLRVCNLHSGPAQVRRGLERSRDHLGAHRIRQVDDARRAHRGDQCDARPPRRDAGKSHRVLVCEPPVVYPAARDSDAFAELRAGHRRCACARIPTCW